MMSQCQRAELPPLLDFGVEPASKIWWQRLAERGTPLRQRLDDGRWQVAFVWRDPSVVAGRTAVWRDPSIAAGRSAFAEVCIDVWTHTEHPVRRRTCMQRLGASDLWFWSTVMPASWCGSYQLLPLPEHAFPAPQAQSERRDWWLSALTSHAVADLFNPLPTYDNGWGVPLSPLLLSAAVVAEVVPLLCGRSQLQGERWECREWLSPRLHTRRRVWHFCSGAVAGDGSGEEQRATSGKGEPLPLVLLLDGQVWAQSLSLLSEIVSRTACGEWRPACYVLIDQQNSAQRGRELTCNETFWQALLAEVIETLPHSVSRDPALRLVAGQSFGGLAALYAALHWPEQFGWAVSQSGSFWWPDASHPCGWLTSEVQEGLGGGLPLQVMLQVGQGESDMRDASQRMATALRHRGIVTRYREFAGGHDWLCWRRALSEALTPFLRLPSASS